MAEQPAGIVRSVQADETVMEKSFAELWQRSGEIAAALQSRDIGPGSPVVLLQRDVLEYIPAFWACLRTGATAVPLTSIASSVKSDELACIVALLGGGAILCDRPSALARRLAALLPEAPIVDASLLGSGGDLSAVDQARVACLIATSGSTGRVKLVALETGAMLHRHYSQNYSMSGLDAHHLGLFRLMV